MLRSRVLTAIVLLGAFLACLFLLPATGFAVLAGVVAVLAAWEWGGLAALGGAARLAFAAACGAAYASLEFALGGLPGGSGVAMALYGLAAAFWLLAVPAWLARGVHLVRQPAPRLPALAIGALVIVPAALAMSGLRDHSPVLLLAVLALAWIADTAAYFAGRRYGRRKLAPAISPGKTWEGVAGGLAASIVYAIILATAAPGGLPGAGGLAWLAYGVLAAILCGIGVVGDLFESAVKRSAGVKDSGSLLPGHGGVLDRIDSATSTLPVAALGLMAYTRWL